ncbi:MAG: phosphoribosylglycinamide formyltransferase [Clostridia bacterium]
MLRIAVLVSGGGTNLQALINSQKNGEIKNGEIKLVLASNSKAFALERAKKADIKTEVLIRKNFSTMDEYSDALISVLNENKIDLVVLAGFMTIISEKVTKAFENKIINVHPSLIPSFCGEGFYGLHVHESALAKGVKVTGATVHFVNEECDGGAIILQKAVEIQENDTAETLQKRVMEQAEWKILPQAVSLFCEGRITVKDNKTEIN